MIIFFFVAPFGIGARHEGQEVDLLLGVDEDPWCSGNESCSDGEAEPAEEPAGDHIHLAVKEEPGECGRDRGATGVAVATATAESEPPRDVLVEKSGSKEIVFSSYHAEQTKDMVVVDHLAKIAAELNDPTLLWVVLAKKERMLRQVSKESEEATKACERVLQAHAIETNRIRRRAALDDAAKENGREIDKFLKRRSSQARAVQPTCIIGDPAKVLSAYKTAVFVQKYSTPIPGAMVDASASAQGSGRDPSLPAPDSYRAVHPKWRARLRQHKKVFKSLMGWAIRKQNSVVKVMNRLPKKPPAVIKKGKAKKGPNPSAPSKGQTTVLRALRTAPPQIPRAILEEHKDTKILKLRHPVAPAAAQSKPPPKQKELACRARPPKADGTPDASAQPCGFMNSVEYKKCMQCGLDFSLVVDCEQCKRPTSVRLRQCKHCAQTMPYVKWKFLETAERTANKNADLPPMRP